MNPGNFTKVFDIVDVSFSAPGLIFIAFGIGLVMFPAALRAVRIPYLDFESAGTPMSPTSSWALPCCGRLARSS
jgi:hypothetical protein